MSKFHSSFKTLRKPENETLLSPAYYIESGDIEQSGSDSIGQGGSAIVYKDSFKGTCVAIKKYHFDNPRLPDNRKLLIKEAYQLQTLQHPNVVKCFGVCLEKGILLLEFAEKIIHLDDETESIHSLRQLIEYLKDTLPVEIKFEALSQVASGLHYLHSNKVIHGDLKSSNVLVTETEDTEYIFKLCDVGQAHLELATKLTTSRSVSSHSSERIGTVPFEAPEVFTSSSKTLKSDIYSFAMIMYELLHPCLAHPWASRFSVGSSDTINMLIMNAVKNGKRPPLLVEPSSYTKLMVACWHTFPDKRPDSANVIEELSSLKGETNCTAMVECTPPSSKTNRPNPQPLTRRTSLTKRRLNFDPNETINERESVVIVDNRLSTSLIETPKLKSSIVKPRQCLAKSRQIDFGIEESTSFNETPITETPNETPITETPKNKSGFVKSRKGLPNRRQIDFGLTERMSDDDRIEIPPSSAETLVQPETSPCTERRTTDSRLDEVQDFDANETSPLQFASDSNDGTSTGSVNDGDSISNDKTDDLIEKYQIESDDDDSSFSAQRSPVKAKLPRRISQERTNESSPHAQYWKGAETDSDSDSDHPSLSSQLPVKRITLPTLSQKRTTKSSFNAEHDSTDHEEAPYQNVPEDTHNVSIHSASTSFSEQNHFQIQPYKALSSIPSIVRTETPLSSFVEARQWQKRKLFDDEPIKNPQEMISKHGSLMVSPPSAKNTAHQNDVDLHTDVDTRNNVDDLSIDLELSSQVDCSNGGVLASTPASSCEVAGRLMPPRSLEMMWAGYAGTRLQITLSAFQLEALFSLHQGKDCVVVQATSSGKSICFQIPAMMMEPGKYAVVVVPTIALGLDHQHRLRELQVKSVFLTSTSKKKEFDSAFDITMPDEERPAVIIMNPETLLGSENARGVVDLLHRDRLKFIAIDEAHLMFEWAHFRNSFGNLAELKSKFDCPLLALSATLKPLFLRLMQTDVLRNPVIIRGSIDRKNVAVYIAPYHVAIADSTENAWIGVATTIEEIAQREKTIVYCAYATECEKLNLAMSTLGLKCASYTGNQTSANDKVIIYENMKAGDIDILIATKAFGMGVNLPDVRHIIHVGLPENLSTWVQEFGRAGRDGRQATATLLICESQDLKKLHFWTKTASHQEHETRTDDFIEVWKYVAAAFSGQCLRKFHRKYFDDVSVDIPDTPPENCCTGCLINKEVPFKDSQLLIRAVLDCIAILNRKGMQHVYETKIVEWTRGSDSDWIWQYFNKSDLEDHLSYGFLSSTTKNESEMSVKGILRQCLSLNYLQLQLKILPGNNTIVAKVWLLTPVGSRVIKQEIHPPNLPDPIIVTQRLLKCREKPVDPKDSKPRSRKGNDIVSQTIRLMKDKQCWTPLIEKKQYEMLGFFHDTTKLLYVEDYTKLKCCPAKPNPNYIWKDVHLSKGSSFKPLEFGLGKDRAENVEFVLQRNHCNGVKICRGSKINEGIETPCTYAVSNKTQTHRCFYHEMAGFHPPTKGCHIMVYIAPISVDDNRRWLGFLSLSDSKAAHNHPVPAASKCGTKLKEDVYKAVELNPTLTAGDLSKGIGLNYNPASVDIAAANYDVLRNLIGKSNIDYTGSKAIATIKNFNRIIKNKVDEQDSKNACSEDAKLDLLNRCTPYLRFESFDDSFSTVLFATPQMLEVLADSMFIEADVTFPGTSAFPYLMNFVAYNTLTMQFQAVARILMTKLDAAAYKFAFQKLFEITTNIHPEFCHGNEVKGWIVDFSLAQREGLAASIGKRAEQVIRGCNVHFLRMAKKVADKVAPKDKCSKDVFLKIASKIPYLSNQSDVSVAFDILQGSQPLEEALQFMSLSENELSVNTDKWDVACDWAEWWQRPKTLKMFTKSFKDMSDADWKICPTTTNAVESHNKISHANTKNFISALDYYYRVDKRSIFQMIAAEQGIPIGISSTKRKKMNERRRSRRVKARLASGYKPSDESDDDEQCDDDESCDGGQCKDGGKSKNKDQCKDDRQCKDDVGRSGPKKKAVGRPKGKSTRSKDTPKNGKQKASTRRSTTSLANAGTSKPIDDENIGKHVWIDTIGKEGTHYGFCEAIIQEKNKKGEYVAKYVQWPEFIAYIPDLYDETDVRFHPAIPV